MEMALANWDKIKQYARNRGCQCQGDMSDKDWDRVKDFIDVGYNRSTGLGRAVDALRGVSSGQLRRKIEILNVPWRSAKGR